MGDPSAAERGAVQWIVALAVGVGAMLLALRGVSLDALTTSLSGVDQKTFALGVSLFLGLHLSRALRWGYLVRRVAPEVRFRSYLSICSVGFLLINVLPFRLGEFVRPWLLAERERVPFGSGMATVVLERLLDVAALGVLLLGALMFAGIPPGEVEIYGEHYDLVLVLRRSVLSVLVPVSLALATLIFLGDRGLALADRISAPLGATVQRVLRLFLGAFIGAVRSVGSVRAILTLILWSCVVWTVNTGSLWLALKAFPFGAAFGFWDAAAVLACLCAVLMLPAPPGFAGVFELGLGVGLAVYGVARSDAAAFALALHASQFLLMSLTGGAFIFIDRIPLRGLTTTMRALRGRGASSAGD